jgi:hypothetical protein
MKKVPWTIPHSKQDCVDIRVDGKHVAYVCYYHAETVMAELADGSDDVRVERWGIKRDFDKVVCCQGD